MALVRPFLPAKDFAQSRAFYEAIGFILVYADADLAIYDYEGAGILLQNYYVEDWAGNSMLQLFVRDLDYWWQRTATLAERFGVRPPAAPEMKPWGLRFDWSLLDGVRHPLPWALSGGLDPANVAEAIRRTGAPLVDVSSGVESAPGVKDVDKIAAFLKAAQL